MLESQIDFTGTLSVLDAHFDTIWQRTLQLNEGLLCISLDPAFFLQSGLTLTFCDEHGTELFRKDIENMSSFGDL